MGALSAAALLVAVLLTAIVSGVFGMAGGLMLMGVLGFLMPVSAAFVTHGLVQLVGNGWRAILHRRHVRWSIVGVYATGSIAAVGLVALVAFQPSKFGLYCLLTAVAGLVWIPKKSLQLDAAKPAHALLCGLSVTGLNLTAGVAGPLLDVFFVRTAMTRHQIVATKAATQVLSHIAKIAVYGAPFLIVGGQPGFPPAWVFVAAIPLSIAGTVIGGRILDRMTDARFINATKWIITAIGATYLFRALQLYFG